MAVIGVSETLVIWLLDALYQWGAVLSPTQNAALDAVLLMSISSPLLWLLALRPLALQIDQKQSQVDEQIASNRGLLDALEAHGLISITDVQGRIVYANDMFCKVSGYTRNELAGQDHRIVNSGHHDPAFIRTLWRTIAQGKVWRGEFCNRTKDGELFWVDSTIVPQLDKDGKPKQYISIHQDTSTRKATELKLTALKRALNASSEMILITNAEGLIQYANPALCLFTGWTEEALMKRQPDVLDSPNVDQKTLAQMQTRLRHSQAWSGRLLGRRRGMPPIRIAGQATPPDALEYWAKINVTPILTSDGALSGYVQIQHDVSDLVEWEAALQMGNADTVARLAISEALHQPRSMKECFIHILDILFDLKTFNLQRKGGVFLTAQDEDYLDMFVLHGKFSDEFIRKEQRIALGACLCGRAAVSGKILVSDDCFCDPRHEHQFDGMQPHGHYIVPIASGGDILGVLFLYTDPYPIQSESRIAMLQQAGEMMALALLQKQAKDSLEAARDTALQVAQTRSAFLANMSHEIRTPMNGVLGMLDLLQDTQLSREQSDLIGIAANSAESLLTIINDILDFSKLEAGKIELEQIEFNLPDLVEEVCTLLSSRAHAQGLELNCFLPTDLPLRWQGDPTRIRQVLTNLIGNAVKFTEQGEVSVKVSAPPVGAALVSTSAAIAAPILRFEISDTGIGISAEAQARLFEAFSQADSSTSRRYGGTGLGLSISRDLVDLMNGSIGVDSALGQGANFWFALPLVPVANDAPAPQANFAGKRVLIVDDNATNRMILTHYLSNWGLTSNEADNGPAAVIELESAALRNEAYDLLLSDMQMPGMDGLALARAIIEKPAIADIPRILLSSGSISSQAERFRSGYTQSLLKPVRQAQLFDAVVDALQLPGTKAAPTAGMQALLPDYSGKRVLVVDDNKVNQKVIIALLAKFQLKPDLADNGQMALDQLERQAYDLVLMDCQMPVMDGYHATRILRERETASTCPQRSPGATPHTPITALTAHASAGELEKCLAAGMDDYLGKPVRRMELSVVLARWLGSPFDSAQGKPFSNTKDESIDNAQGLPFSKVQALTSNKGQGLPRAESRGWDESLALKRLDGDHDLLTEMIALFLEEAPVSIAELDAALSQADLLALADAAHAIKGMAGHFCAEKIISLAANLEHAARNTADADFKLMSNDLTRATLDLVRNLHIKKDQNHEY